MTELSPDGKVPLIQCPADTPENRQFLADFAKKAKEWKELSIDLARDLKHIKTTCLWMLEYRSFREFCVAALGINVRTAARALQAYETWSQLSGDSRTSKILPMLKSAHLNALYRVPPERRLPVLEAAVSSGPLTASNIVRAARLDSRDHSLRDTRNPHNQVRLMQGARHEGGHTFGEPIDFRGLRHAPINEQGVIFLFGMLARDLGFLVEAVQIGFPDCEAKRTFRKGKWKRVRIEFEYESKNFLAHGHPFDGCDVIVCWRHNWAECPANLEVVELSSVIQSLGESED